jgi:hypothetical protein
VSFNETFQGFEINDCYAESETNCQQLVWHISDFLRNHFLKAGRENVLVPFRQVAAYRRKVDDIIVCPVSALRH